MPDAMAYVSGYQAKSNVWRIWKSRTENCRNNIFPGKGCAGVENDLTPCDSILHLPTSRCHMEQHEILYVWLKIGAGAVPIGSIPLSVIVRHEKS